MILLNTSGLESSARAMQKQVDASNRKYSTAETILRNITQERDSAVSQLGVAFVTIEQLKMENESLKEENSELKGKLGRLTNDHENETQKWTSKEESLRRKLDRRSEAVKSLMEKTGVQMPGIPKKSAVDKAHSRDTEMQRQKIDSPVRKDANTMFDLRSGPDAESLPARNQHQTIQIDDTQESEDAMYEVPKAKGKGKAQATPSRRFKSAQNDEISQDLTYLSFLDVKSCSLRLFS